MGLDKSACANQSQKLLDDGQAGSYRFVRRISTDKRARLDRTDQLGNYCQQGRVVGRR